jgi:chemosensory pili system protein ChpA (sensor histidine kinase/response regulator)
MSEHEHPVPAGEPRDDDPGQFLPEGWDTVRAIAAGVEALGGDRPGEALESLALLSHRLAGSSALYGLEAVAAIAGAVERAVAAIARGDERARELGTPLLRDAVGALRDALAAVGRGNGGNGRSAGGLLDRLAAFAPPAPEGGAEAPGAAGDPLAAALRAFAAEHPEDLEFFGPEAREQTEGMADALARLAAGGDDDRRSLEELFRLTHTLKGAAYMVECGPVGDLAHAMEDLLVPAREGVIELRGPALKVLEDAADVLQRMLAALDGAAVELEGPFAGVRARLGRLLAEAPAADAAADGGEADRAPRPVTAPATAETPTTVPAASETPAAETPAAGMPVPEAPASPAEAAAGAAARERTIRVGLGRIDHLMSLVGEAVVAGARLERRLERLAQVERQLEVSRERMVRAAEEIERQHADPAVRGEQPASAGPRRLPADSPAVQLGDFSELELDRYDRLDLLRRQIAEISFDLAESQAELVAVGHGLGTEVDRTTRLLRGLRSAVGRTRMLRLEPLFQRFRRRVDRAGRDEGKRVGLELAGGHVEVDTAIVERIADPLLHLIGNALTHGVESPGERRAAGKPEEATIALRAYLRGVFVDLEVEDDGRGLDHEALRRRAVALGMASEEEAARLSDAEALELILAPGFSTVEEATGAAGRGVGMDVVRTAVAELNGQVRIETLPGQGTRITLRLPITLVVSTALMLRAGGETLALPTLNVRRLVSVAPGGVEARDGREWVAVEGESVELIRLAAALGLDDAGDKPGAGAGDPLPLVVVQAPGRPVAMAVDELIGIEEVVVRGLGGFLAGLPAFGGVTVGVDGRVVLVLDPAGLPGLGIAAGRRALPAAPAAEAWARPRPAGAPVLLADDSISVRKVLGRQLGAAGWEVVVVADGEQALEALRERTFAALITDIEMPRLNGFELLDLVRRRPETRELPAIVLTSRAGAKHRELARRLGATAYLSKPVDLSALLAALGAASAADEAAAAGGGGAS